MLSSIPIIGNLFKSKAIAQNKTELMVLITPRLVKPLDPDEVPPLPTTRRSSCGRSEVPKRRAAQLAGGAGTVDAPQPRSQRRWPASRTASGSCKYGRYGEHVNRREDLRQCR